MNLALVRTRMVTAARDGGAPASLAIGWRRSMIAISITAKAYGPSRQRCPAERMAFDAAAVHVRVRKRASGPNASYGHGPNGERSPRFTRIGFAKRNRAAQRTARSRSVMQAAC
jgi:hypothetical protein